MEELPNTRVGNHVAGQLLKAGTSPYPHQGEAQAAESPRTITSDEYEEFRLQMSAKMHHPQAKEVYQNRKSIVEPVFGQIRNRSFNGFAVRGLTAVCGEFSLVCVVHNLKKIAKYGFGAKLRPESGKLT